jgi:ubiquitin-conjugating enzyme E2 S
LFAVGTPFVGGSFKIKLVLSHDYPKKPPKGNPVQIVIMMNMILDAGYFLTKIFHPNVALTGDICVNTLKQDWEPGLGISHVLQVIRCLLIVPFPESSLNDEAGKLFMESYEEYTKRALLWTSIHARSKHAEQSKCDIKPTQVRAADSRTHVAELVDKEKIQKAAKRQKKKNLKRL